MIATIQSDPVMQEVNWIAPDTPQVMISFGRTVLPESPIFRRSLSITKATLAIYPVSSRIDEEEKQMESRLSTSYNVNDIAKGFVMQMYAKKINDIKKIRTKALFRKNGLIKRTIEKKKVST